MDQTRAIGAGSSRGVARAYGLAWESSDAQEVAVKTQGEVKAAICQGMSRFEQEYMGRGPKASCAHLIDDLVATRSGRRRPYSAWDDKLRADRDEPTQSG